MKHILCMRTLNRGWSLSERLISAFWPQPAQNRPTPHSLAGEASWSWRTRCQRGKKTPPTTATTTAPLPPPSLWLYTNTHTVQACSENWKSPNKPATVISPTLNIACKPESDQSAKGFKAPSGCLRSSVTRNDNLGQASPPTDLTVIKKNEVEWTPA